MAVQDEFSIQSRSSLEDFFCSAKFIFRNTTLEWKYLNTECVCVCVKGGGHPLACLRDGSGSEQNEIIWGTEYKFRMIITQIPRLDLPWYSFL